MKVKLIASTPFALNVIYMACTTCYSENIKISAEQDKMLKLVNQVAKSGHLSTFEHVNFTFAIEGISRACSHQLVRHRHCSFSQQSQRYVDMSECDFVNENPQLEKVLNVCRNMYADLVGFGMKKEDARIVLPNATPTNLIMTCNLRELIHVCNLRLCTRAQSEIRTLLKEIVKEVLKIEPWLKDYLVPQCERLGYCPEGKSCGRKQKLEELINAKN